MTTTLVRCSIAAVAILATAVPANAGGSLHIHVGTPGFGLSYSSTTWAPYGHAWADPGWSVDVGVALGGYGDWVDVSGLGRVWRPWVAPGWRPYTHGRWVWTSVGWTWVAYEPWGWIPHHFGHWAYAPAGWVWVPGTVWHPGNVTWVHHAGWVGWYPCPPRGWSHAARGWHHGYAHGYDDGYRDGWRDARYATWVDWTHLGTVDDVSRVAVARDRISRLDAPGAVQVLDGGPSRAAVEARTRRPVTEASLERRAVTIDGRTVSVARPAGAAVDDGLRRSAPRTVETALAPVARRTRPEVGSRPAVAARPAPASAASRRATAPSVRPGVGASRATPVIDDEVVRSLRRPSDVVRDVAPPAAPTGAARVVRPTVPAAPARVEPRRAPSRAVEPTPSRQAAPTARAVAPDPRYRVQPLADRPAAAPPSAAIRTAPGVRRAPSPPERELPVRTGAPAGRALSVPSRPVPRTDPGPRVVAPRPPAGDAAGPSPRVVAGSADARPTQTKQRSVSRATTADRSGSNRRSNR